MTSQHLWFDLFVIVGRWSIAFRAFLSKLRLHSKGHSTDQNLVLEEIAQVNADKDYSKKCPSSCVDTHLNSQTMCTFSVNWRATEGSIHKAVHLHTVCYYCSEPALVSNDLRYTCMLNTQSQRDILLFVVLAQGVYRFVTICARFVIARLLRSKSHTCDKKLPSFPQPSSASPHSLRIGVLATCES